MKVPSQNVSRTPKNALKVNSVGKTHAQVRKNNHQTQRQVLRGLGRVLRHLIVDPLKLDLLLEAPHSRSFPEQPSSMKGENARHHHQFAGRLRPRARRHVIGS